MKHTVKYIALAAIAALASCEPEFENSVEDSGFYSSGEANLSNFVAVGNSLTAGYADGALYITGQENSFPNIMAQQFAKAGGSETFTQPLMADNLGGLLLGGMQIQPRWISISQIQISRIRSTLEIIRMPLPIASDSSMRRQKCLRYALDIISMKVLFKKDFSLLKHRVTTVMGTRPDLRLM